MGSVTIPNELTFAGVRFLLAGIIIFVFSLFYKKRIPTVSKSKVIYVIIYGLVQTGALYLFNYIGVTYTTATKTSILTSLTAFLAVVFAPLFFKDEKLTVQKIIGVIIGLIGIVIVNLNAFSGSFTFMGEGMIIIAMLCNTAGGFIGKAISKGKVIEVTSYQLSIGGIALLVIGLLFGGTFFIDVNLIIITIILALVSSVAFLLWTELLVYNEAGKILVYNLLIPVFGSIWSFIILGEKEIFNPLFIVSVVLISIGIILVNISRDKNSRSKI